jgi:hypothetical protein
MQWNVLWRSASSADEAGHRSSANHHLFEVLTGAAAPIATSAASLASAKVRPSRVRHRPMWPMRVVTDHG